MIFHFPNFVCWREIFSGFDSDRDNLFLDGVSCHVVGLMLGVRGTYFSGPQMALDLKLSGSKDLFFLLAFDIESIAADYKYVLPFKDSFVDDERLLRFLSKIKSGSSVVIGISAPKQNALARYLHSIRDDLDFYCLGAAVSQTWDKKYGNTILRGTGLQWLEFLVFEPKRTLKKQFQTWREIARVLFSRRRRERYRKFVRATESK